MLPGLTTSSWGLSLSLGPGGVLLRLLLSGVLLRLLLSGVLLRLLLGGVLLRLLLGGALLRLLLGGALLRLLLNSLPRRRRMRRRYLPSRRWGRMCCRRGCARCRLRRPLGYRRLSLGFPGGSKV